jgi:pyrimidine-specific ribonucleoside hydrolase
MTNEIHGHAGIYTIIGAKMGVRAMEFFNVGVNNLTATTFAGHKPPLSCFNDGIQISSGATIGQGLITISDSLSVVPTAIFEFNNQKVKISLKPEIAAQMQKEIKYGVQEHGLLTAQYWLYIEELAIKYWSNYNRYEIFNITML